MTNLTLAALLVTAPPIARADLAGKIYKAISGNETVGRRSIDELIAKKEGRPQPEDNRDYQIYKYREANITQNFHGALEANLSGYIFENNQPQKVKANFFQTSAEHITLNGERQLIVRSYSQLIHRNGKETTSAIVIIKDGSFIEVRHREDKSVTKYEWINVPTSMKIGTEVTVGNVREQDSKGNTTASGKLLFSIDRSALGMEFCQIEILTERPKRMERVERECRVFDGNGKLKKIGVITSIDGVLQLILDGPIKAGNLTQPPYTRN